jgi:hypothetical protein
MKEEIDVWAETILAVMTTVWSKVAGILPNLFAAVIIMVIGYFIARFIGFLLSRLLHKVGFDGLSGQVGVVGTLERAGIKLSPSEIVGALGFWVIILTFLVTATESLGLPRVSATIDDVVLYLPKVIAAAVIFVIGLFLANFLRDLVRSGAEGLGVKYAKPLGTAAYAIMFVVIVSLSINELEIETELLNSVISILLAAVGVALALSLGLGTRDLAANLVAGFYARDLYQEGVKVDMDLCAGAIERIGAVKATIKCEDSSLMTVANTQLIDNAVRVKPVRARTRKK